VGIGCGVTASLAVGAALGTTVAVGKDGEVGLESPVLAAHPLVRRTTALKTTRVEARK
jgi:hypothetical protein